MATVFMVYPEEKLFWREFTLQSAVKRGEQWTRRGQKMFCAEERFMMFASQELL